MREPLVSLDHPFEPEVPKGPVITGFGVSVSPKKTYLYARTKATQLRMPRSDNKKMRSRIWRTRYLFGNVDPVVCYVIITGAQLFPTNLETMKEGQMTTDVQFHHVVKLLMPGLKLAGPTGCSRLKAGIQLPLCCKVTLGPRRERVCPSIFR